LIGKTFHSDSPNRPSSVGNFITTSATPGVFGVVIFKLNWMLSAELHCVPAPA
jgi:hypothetical protein